MANEGEEGSEGTGSGGGTGGVEVVSRDIFNRVVRAKDNLETQVGTQKDDIARLESQVSGFGSVTQSLETAQAELAKSRQAFTDYRDIATALKTTNSDAIDATQWQYGKLPSEDRPELKAWLDAFKTSPDTVPGILRPFLDTDTSANGTPARQNGRAAPPAGPADYTETQIAAIGKLARETGDYSEYRVMRKAMGFKTQ